MKNRVLVLGLALCMALTGCGKTAIDEIPSPTEELPTVAPSATAEVTVTPEPTATPAPTPAPWETDPKGYILDRLDEMLDGEEIFLRFWIHPGSGPTPSWWSTAEYGATVRELFAALDWEVEEPEEYDENKDYSNEPYNQPGAYGITFYDGAYPSKSGYFHVSLNDDSMRMNPSQGPEIERELCFRADGAEKLCEKLTDMEPSVYVNMGRVRVPAQKSAEATVKLYLETALKRTKENGHITDYAIRAYEVTAFSEEDPPNSISYTATYAFKPAHPELWANLNADGWVEESINVDGNQDFLDYDERDGCYGMF